ncbi:hypothetical protein GBA65_19685 [Rubrobacter marinus]|uniref:Protein kinase domain-containing protein n=1 Tax=Rubrobacter marinus TaxID=2653852 RepID=A0A6G8Q1L8_9ACTN|nr:AarF/UbiB family protein [Rubrobacter marinus]QIN80369.1 hypothetical protein GBA65_19685 [Rubrobacter marinus]
MTSDDASPGQGERDPAAAPSTGPGDPWQGLRASGEVFSRAAVRSGEEARAVFEAMVGGGDAAGAVLPARLADFYRAQAFLWTGAGFAAGERLGRAVPGFSPAVRGVLSQRALVLGVIAADLWTGYAALRERARWFPWLVRDEDWTLQHRRGAVRLLDAAGSLGGTLIKAGQFASTRPDLLPTAYTQTLSRLQDRVEPQPWPVIEGAVSREIGGPISGAFRSFEPEPIAAASIAQVHRAVLADGRPVAVKVQYPNIERLIEADLSALEGIFEAISRLEPSVRLGPILEYLRWTLPLELDFVREAGAIRKLGRALGDRGDVAVPGVIEGLNTQRLLVMELAEGVKITDREALVRAGIDPKEVAEKLVDAYAEQIFGRGVLHADPHPGNLLVRPGPDGPVLVLLDHGLTVEVPDGLAESLRAMILALEEGDLDALTAGLERAGLRLGPEVDLETLLGLVGVLLGGERTDGPGDVGELGLKLGASVGSIPVELLLMGRAIGLLDGITRGLDEDLDTVGIVARYARG